MDQGEDFIDHYAVLGVEPDCDAKTLERAYRELAHQFHPDHGESADVIRLQMVLAAYRTLREPGTRGEYDAAHAAAIGRNREPLSDQPVPGAEDQPSPASDADAHERILQMLYQNRRENSREAGVIGYFIQQMLACSDESYDFHLWYLKSKGFVEITEHGTVAITIAGVDEVISNSRRTEAIKLLTEREDRTA